MQVFSEADSFQKWRESKGIKSSVLTIGNFDGVHRGHRQLICEIVTATGASQDSVSVLLSFFPHPVQVLRPEKKHTRLFNLQDQQAELAKLELQAIVRQPFSRRFSEQTPEDFLQNYILKYFHPRMIVIRHDFSFGAYQKRNTELLSEFCKKHGIDLQVIPAMKTASGKVISTSHVREALRTGELALAEEMLGRKYYLKGVVEKGDQRGRLLGFPTANIRPDVDFYPQTGVYACYVSADIFSQEKAPVKKAVMNIGINRTFVEGDHNPIKIEIHLLDFAGDLYGRNLKVEFCHYLREEKKFGSLDELKKQIALDVLRARDLLK